MEQGSVFSELMIGKLISVHALSCYHRADGRAEHRLAALEHIEDLQILLNSLKRELENDRYDYYR